MKESIELLIFDFDGTLANTAGGIQYAINKILENRDQPTLDLETVTSYIGRGLFELVRKVNPKWMEDPEGLKLVAQEFRQHYAEVYLNEINLYPGVLEFLQNCQQKVAIVSNKEEFFVKETVAKCELKDFEWVSVYGGNSFPHKKPHPIALHSVMEVAQVTPEQTVMIGDSVADLGAAQAANTHHIAVDFGYESIESLKQNGATHSFSNFAELAQVIDTL